jgi:hypothetical protein
MRQIRQEEGRKRMCLAEPHPRERLLYRSRGHKAIGWGVDFEKTEAVGKLKQEAGFNEHLVKPADLHKIEQLLAELPAVRAATVRER